MLVRVLAFAAGLAAAAPAAAQDLLCCGLMVPFGGKWIGLSGDCHKQLAEASKEQLAKACETINELDPQCESAKGLCVACDEEKLKGLRGRMRGLGEAQRAHQKSRHDSQAERSEARDRLWGKGEGLKFEGGSISAFGEAALESVILATGGGGSVGHAYGQVRAKYSQVRGWAETSWNLGSNPGAVESWTALGEKLIGEQADAVLENRGARSAAAAREHFRKTGNAAGAQRVYRQTWAGYGKLKDFKDKADKFTGALDKLRTLYESGDALANDLQDWTDAYRDNEAAKRDMQKIDEEMARVQKDIDRLAAACGQKPAARVPWLHFASTHAKKPAAAGGGDETLRRAGQALAAVRAFQGALAQADARLGAQVIAPLSPWLAGTWREAERAVLLELVKASRADLERFERTLGELARLAAQARERVNALPRDAGR